MSSKTKKEPKVKPHRQPERAPQGKTKETPDTPPRSAETPTPKGPIPVAMVMSRHEGAMVERQARGFSMGELGGAGFSLHRAGKMGLPADIRRRTVLEKNVKSLKSWFSPQKQARKPEAVGTKVATEPEQKPKKRAPAKKSKVIRSSDTQP